MVHHPGDCRQTFVREIVLVSREKTIYDQYIGGMVCCEDVKLGCHEKKRVTVVVKRYD
jgi:hypothetical protein